MKNPFWHSNSADPGTGHDLLFREFIDIEAIPGEPLSNFFDRLQETMELLAGTDHQIFTISSPHSTSSQSTKGYDMIRTIIEDKTSRPAVAAGRGGDT